MALNAVVKDVDADISLDMVKKNIVKLSTYETVSYNSANGNSNMKTALEACNGSVLEPGKYGRLTNAQAIQTFLKTVTSLQV